MLVPYDRYQALLADREKSQTGQGSKKKKMTPKLGPPGIPVKDQVTKNNKQWISL